MHLMVSSFFTVRTPPTGSKDIPLVRSPPAAIPPAPGGPLPKVSLEDGVKIILIPLYEGLMEKPYFHLLSREGAKKLVLQGNIGNKQIL